MFQVHPAWVEKGIYDRASMPFEIVNMSVISMSTLQNVYSLNVSLTCSLKERFVSLKMLSDHVTDNMTSFTPADIVKTHKSVYSVVI